jgi:Ice-binding-like
LINYKLVFKSLKQHNMKKLFLLFNLFFFVGILNAQISPILGSASSFGVLSGGTVTSTDTIKVTGNVGAMGTVGGKIMATTIYAGGGVIVTNALADLNTAKSSLTAQGGTSISGTLGGQSLNSGVYAISGNAILNDTIILNGDTNAVFIFNITGDLIINSNSMVKTSLFKSVNLR